MCLEVGRIDHDPLRFSGLARQFDKDAVEHPQAAPADEAVVDRLVRSVSARRITPPQAVLDDKDDLRYNQPVIDPGNTVRQWEIWLNPAHLRLAQQKQIVHKQHLLGPPLNQPSTHHASNLTGPDTRLRTY